MKNDLIKLVFELNNQDADGFPVSTKTEKEYFAEMQSVKRSEYYAAASAKQDVHLTCVMNYCDYDVFKKKYGKPSKVVYDGDTYIIVRTYRKKKANDIELTLAEVE